MPTTLPTSSRQQFKSDILAGRVKPGMTFNEKVWALCARVPAGRVVTYRDIATALNTRGYRAVGNALNKNPYAPAVPCHRVVGSNGALTGFAGGLKMKEELLKNEGMDIRKGRIQLTEQVAGAL